jgi:hypothetical protein
VEKTISMDGRAEIDARKVVILGTGGTIAGRAVTSSDNVGYVAGQVGVEQLVAEVPMLASLPLEIEQVAQINSKDMTVVVWQRLAARLAFHLDRPDVSGVVITHGTDTLEETAFFLDTVFKPTKPVVLTCAMRPATALVPDGPQNLLDAVSVARHPGGLRRPDSWSAGCGKGAHLPRECLRFRRCGAAGLRRGGPSQAIPCLANWRRAVAFAVDNTRAIASCSGAASGGIDHQFCRH